MLNFNFNIDSQKSSCITNMLCCFEEITKGIDEGSPVGIIYLDFQKAFDEVPPHRYGLINWIENWQTDRIQRVVVNGDRK